MREFVYAVLLALVFAKIWLVFHMVRDYREQPSAFDWARVATYSLWFAAITVAMVVVGLTGTRFG